MIGKLGARRKEKNISQEELSHFETKLLQQAGVLEQLMRERSERELLVEFHSGLLRIKKRDKEQQGWPELPAERWRALRNKLSPQHVKRLYIDTVNMGESTSEIFDFASTSVLKVLIVDNVKDGTTDNVNVANGLKKALGRAGELEVIHIRRTPLGERWGVVLSSLSSPHLRFLSLSYNQLAGCGQQLAAWLAWHQHLVWLYLTQSGLSGQEMVLVLDSLAASCPQLVGLELDGNDLSHAEQALGNIIEQRPLRVLTVFGSNLSNQLRLSPLQKTQTIEVLDISSNSPLFDSTHQESLLYSLVEQRPSLRYLRFHPPQLSPEGRDQVHTLLQSRGGRLIVLGAGDPGWQEYKAHVVKLRNECINF